MFLTIALNVVFAVLVVGGIVGLLGHSIWASRAERISTAHVHAQRPAAAHAHAQARRPARARVATSTS